jgi:hypothetical protein
LVVYFQFENTKKKYDEAQASSENKVVFSWAAPSGLQKRMLGNKRFDG